MDFRIAGKAAFVSGGSKGVGRAVARFLAKEGCRVVVAARGQEGIDDAVAEIRDLGGTATGVSVDLVDAAQVKRAVAVAREAYGSPSIVITQTNDFTSETFLNTQDEEFERIFRAFTMSSVYLIREVLPDMRSARWGRVVHIGSGACKEPANTLPFVYHNTVRPSTVGLFKSLADEFARDGITFNIVSPSWTETEAMYDYLETAMGVPRDQVPEWLERSEGIPAARMGSVDEVGSLIAYFCSEWAGYVNGVYVPVDGSRHRAAF